MRGAENKPLMALEDQYKEGLSGPVTWPAEGLIESKAPPLSVAFVRTSPGPAHSSNNEPFDM